VLSVNAFPVGPMNISSFFLRGKARVSVASLDHIMVKGPVICARDAMSVETVLVVCKARASVASLVTQ